MIFSLWTETQKKSLDDIIKNIMNYREWNVPLVDEFDNTDLKYDIIQKFKDNKELDLGTSKVEFNVINYEFEKVRRREAKNPMRTTRVQTISGFVIIFSDGTTTKFIVNKGKSGTLTTLRRINNYSKNKEIEVEEFKIDSDLFFWIVSKVIDFPGSELGEAQNTMIDSINAFKGETDDRLAEISGSGNRVLNLISTLSFLLENENLSRVGLTLKHQGNTYGLKLGVSGFIDINFEQYVGEYMFNPEDEKVANIVLKIFLIVIPDLLNIYDNEVEEDAWNNERKNAFLTEIGQSLQERIKQKLGLLDV